MTFEHAGLWGPDNLDNRFGRPLVDTEFEVRLPGTSTLADLWADRNRAVAVDNPATTGPTGNVSFFADPGYYDLYCLGTTLRVLVPLDPADAAVTGTGAVSGFASLAEDNTFLGEQLLVRPLYAEEGGTVAKPLCLLVRTDPEADPVLMGSAIAARIDVGVDIVTGGLGFALRDPIADAWDGHGILTVGWVGADEETGAPAYRAQFVRAEQLTALATLTATPMSLLVPVPVTDNDATPKVWVLARIAESIGSAVSGLVPLDEFAGVAAAVTGLGADVTALEARNQFLMPGPFDDDYPVTGDYGDELNPYVIDPSLHAGVAMQITSAADFHVRFVNPGPGWNGTFYLGLINISNDTPRMHVVREDGTEIASGPQATLAAEQTMACIFESGPTELTKVVIVRL